MQTLKKDEFLIRSFEDILRALRQKPEWADEMRRLILSEELLALPGKFESFRQKEFKPLKEKVDKVEQDVGVLKQDVGMLKQDVGVLKQDVEVLKQDVEVLKQDVEVLKQDVAFLKGNEFERTVRERAPAYLGRLIRRCRGIGFEELADSLEDAMDRGLVSEEEKNDALLVDAVVRGKLKTGKDVVLAVEVSLKVDVEDIERAGRRAVVIGRASGIETIGVAIGKECTDRAKKMAEELNVVVV